MAIHFLFDEDQQKNTCLKFKQKAYNTLLEIKKFRSCYFLIMTYSFFIIRRRQLFVIICEGRGNSVHHYS